MRHSGNTASEPTVGLYDPDDARGWSIGLDLSLIVRTPFALLRQRNATR